MRLHAVVLLMLLLLGGRNAHSQTVQDRLKTLEAEVESLQQEIEALKRETATTQSAQEATQPAEPPTKTPDRDFADQIQVPDLGGDEREHKLQAKPEIFIQTRFSRKPVLESDPRETE